MPEQPSPRDWRELLRMFLRSMMILVLIIGSGLGWVIHRASVQRDAVAAIRRAGGLAHYDWELHYGRYDPKHVLWQVSIVEPARRPPWPPWIVALLGIDALTEVKMAHIGRTNPDGVMTSVGELRSLEELTFDEDSPLTDAGMVHLRGLTELKVLMLPKGKITGEALANLEGLTRLRSLSIPRISLESADLSPLRRLTELEDLIMAGSRGARCDLGPIRDLEQLQILSLTGIVIKDLEPIQQLPHLLSLNLVDSELDDAGLAPLGEPGSLPLLVGLYLTNTRISNAGLKTLPKLASVRPLPRRNADHRRRHGRPVRHAGHGRDAQPGTDRDHRRRSRRPRHQAVRGGGAQPRFHVGHGRGPETPEPPAPSRRAESHEDSCHGCRRGGFTESPSVREDHPLGIKRDVAQRGS
jgi:hypothetical protein